MSKKDTKQEAMNTAVKVFVLTALVSLPLGYVVGNAMAGTKQDSAASQNEESANTDDASMMMEHDHEMFMVESAGAPEITSFTVTEDSKKGWNLRLETKNMTFAPQSAGGSHVDNEGHAHLYIDGTKVTRIYSEDFYIGELTEGEHTIRVTLNTNDHKDYVVDGAVIDASQVVVDDHHADDDSDDAMTHDESVPHTH